jgi:hypothetical protein
VKKTNKLIFGLAIVLISCSEAKQTLPILKNEFTPTRLAELTDKRLEEVSGLAASANNPGLLWAHNDSGNSAEILLIDDSLNIKLVCKIKGVDNRDWEDIAVGPGPEAGKQYIYLADIGDNDEKHKFKFIYRFDEPTLQPGEKEIEITSADKITFQLPDQKKDTEALLIDPHTRDLYVVSKREEPVYVYQLKYPYATTGEITANKIVSLPFGKVVGADVSPDGKEILMKNYNKIFYWKTSTSSAVDAILKQSPSEVPYEAEPQGESITWARDGSGFYTLSEKNPNKPSYLYFYKRKNGNN